MESLFYILRSIAALIAVIWLVNVVLKYLNKFSNKKTNSIQIIERITVSKTSSLAIVRIIDEFYLMSISETSSEILQKLDAEETEVIKHNQITQEESIPNEYLKKIDLKKVKEKYADYFNQPK